MGLNDYPQNVNDKMTMTKMTMSVGLGMPSLWLHSRSGHKAADETVHSSLTDSPACLLYKPHSPHLHCREYLFYLFF